MLSYIKGTITMIEGNTVVIEANKIGYLIKTPTPFNFKIGMEATIYTYLHVREDLLELYGFCKKEEKDLFLQLISVKGLGPKGALAILASGQIEEVIDAINKADSKFLQRFPGIGAKASQQIVLDLHGKLNFTHTSSAFESPKVTKIKDALKGMGYTSSELKAVTSILEENIDKDETELLRIALKKLVK